MGVIAFLFVLLRWSYGRNHRFSRDVLLGYFRRRFRVTDPGMAEAATKLLLSSFATLFLLLSVFGFLVASGIIRNGNKIKPPASNESRVLQDYLRGSGGGINMQELIRKNKSDTDK